MKSLRMLIPILLLLCAAGTASGQNDARVAEQKRVIAALGYDYAISKRTAVYAMTGWSQEKVEKGTTEAKPNGYEFTTGIVHRF